MNKTAIEYLDYSWNPIAMRCTPISEGCSNCWHLAMAKRLAANPSLSDERRAAYAGGAPVLVESEIDAPLRHKKPARIGVQFMGDLFHESIDFYDEHITHIFEMMSAARRHQFLVLTKRPERMLEWARWESSGSGEGFPCGDNIWLGVTAENQARADERIPILLSIPAAGHFVSLEPMLSAIDLTPYLPIEPKCPECGAKVGRPKCLFELGPAGCPRFDLMDEWQERKRRGFLAHVIAGGESGPGARPTHPDWVRWVRDQCQEGGVPFFWKSWGAWAPLAASIDYPHRAPYGTFFENGEWTLGVRPLGGDIHGLCAMFRGDKKAAGRLLDGREWDEYPEAMRK